MNIKSILTTCFVICAVHVSAQTPLYKQSSAPVESRVKDLLGRMTVDEKIGQLCCPLGWEMYTKTSKGVVPSELYKERMSAAPIGSFWAVLRADHPRFSRNPNPIRYAWYFLFAFVTWRKS